SCRPRSRRQRIERAKRGPARPKARRERPRARIAQRLRARHRAREGDARATAAAPASRGRWRPRQRYGAEFIPLRSPAHLLLGEPPMLSISAARAYFLIDTGLCTLA